MAKFLIAYLGHPKPPASPEAGAAHMEKYKAWMGGLGDALVSPPTPMPQSVIVSAGGVSEDTGPEAMTGYMIVEADDMDAAVALAKSDPYLGMDGGKLQVGKLMNM